MTSVIMNARATSSVAHRALATVTDRTPDHASPDARLLERLRLGDGDAFEELVRTNGGRLLAVARRLLRDEEDARDAVQQAFLSAFRALPMFHGQSLLSTWLHRILVNAALMKLRSRARHTEESIEKWLPQFLDDGRHASPVPDSRESVDVLLARREVRLQVREAIDRLPDTYRTIVLLRDIEQLDTAEVAAALGVTVNAVKLRLHRARQALARLLQPVLRPDRSRALSARLSVES
jgi:RNA polymerase sigma-70 factor (ECF subfamily)